MKSKVTKILASTVVSLVPLFSEATPVAQLFCQFQDQEGRFILKDNPHEAVAYVQLESDGLCALGTAYLDENQKVHLNLSVYESCLSEKVAQTPMSEISGPSFQYLEYSRPTDGKRFAMGCEIERYAESDEDSRFIMRRK